MGPVGMAGSLFDLTGLPSTVGKGISEPKCQTEALSLGSGCAIRVMVIDNQAPGVGLGCARWLSGLCSTSINGELYTLLPKAAGDG